MQIVDSGVPLASLAKDTPKPKNATKGEDFKKTLSDDSASLPETESARPEERQGDASVTTEVILNSHPQGDPDALPGQVLYPWQLAAQAAISQSGQHAYGLAANGQQSAGAMTALHGAAVLFFAPGAPSAGLAFAGLQGAEADQVATAFAIGNAKLSTGKSSGISDLSAGQAASTLGAWAERIQRRTEDAQGRATVWLRDYRIDASTTDQHVKDIIAFYGPERPVWRIVVNGSEIWRRPSNQLEKT